MKISKEIKYSEVDYGIEFKFRLDDPQLWIKVLPVMDDPKRPKRICFVNLMTSLLYEISKSRYPSDYKRYQSMNVFIKE